MRKSLSLRQGDAGHNNHRDRRKQEDRTTGADWAGWIPGERCEARYSLAAGPISS